MTQAPARLCAIHAIELYLNAYLRSLGNCPGSIRGRLHDLSDDGSYVMLKLRKKTTLHLEELTCRREYLIARYGPELSSEHTQMNRLRATLDEIGRKVCVILGQRRG